MAIRRNLSQPLAVSAFDGPDKPKRKEKTKKKIVRRGKTKKEVKEFSYETTKTRPDLSLSSEDMGVAEISKVTGTEKKKYTRKGKLKKKVTKTETAPVAAVGHAYFDGKRKEYDPRYTKAQTKKTKTKVKYK